MKPDKFFVLVCPCVPETMPAAMNPASPYDTFFQISISIDTKFWNISDELLL